MAAEDSPFVRSPLWDLVRGRQEAWGCTDDEMAAGSAGATAILLYRLQ